MEYLLLALDFGEILLLLAGFGPLQAALLEVLEPGGDGGALDRPRGVTAVLWGPREQDVNRSHLHHLDIYTTNTQQVQDASDGPLCSALSMNWKEEKLRVQTDGVIKHSDSAGTELTLVHNPLSANMKTNIL